ncbi:MAG: peptidyl-prolyl cis-trans isomerase [Armatimonadetes bacterium]|nr:peptidyl-prolyl cis-trans isomerase [Armatimonadota bacterium]
MHRMRISLVALLALAVLVSTLAGCGRKGLVRVNGEKVMKEEFYSRLEMVPVQTPRGVQPAGQYVMEQIIGEMLVQQLAKKEGVATTEAQVNKKIEAARKQSEGNLAKALQRQGLTMEDFKKKVASEQALINIITKGVNISDAEVKKAYDQALAAKNSPLKRPEQVMISAIITAKKDKVDKAYKLLSDGTAFGTVAMKMSEAPGAKETQGKLNWLAKENSQIPKPIRDTAFSLPTGSFSKPFQAAGGWVILRTDQKRPPKTTSFDEVKDMIKEQLALRQGSMNGKFRDQLRDFTKKADITINYDRYKNLPSVIKKQAAEVVTPPEAGNPATAKPISTTNP